MFINYKIKDEILYLYVDDKIEIGSFLKNCNHDLKNKIIKYIKDRKIRFNGTIVTLVVSGIVIGSMCLTNEKILNNNYESDYKYVYNILNNSIPSLENKEDNKGNFLNNIIEENNKHEEKIIKENTSVSDKNKGVSKNSNTSSSTKNESISKNYNINISSNDNNYNAENKDINTSSNIDNKDYLENDKKITLYRSNGQVIDINLDEYLIGVVSAEMPASFSLEALKAQSVIARTYTLKLISSNRKITDTVQTQVYKDNNELKNIWKSNYNFYYEKIKSAVLSTKDECIKYNGSLIDAVYHSTSNGYTEDSVYVWGNSIPYLKSVPSLWDKNVSSYLRNVTLSFGEISNKLGMDFSSSSIIEIIKKDESGRINKIKINDREYTGVQVRNLLGLRSSDFDYEIKEDGIIFTTRGYGHGVGLSQYGANEMAKEGYNYKQIINHYYTNVSIEK